MTTYETLADCAEVLEKKDYELVKKSALSEDLEQDRQELIASFKREFKDVPKDSRLRLETLQFLGKLGIVVLETPENSSDDDSDDSEEEREKEYQQLKSELDDISASLEAERGLKTTE